MSVHTAELGDIYEDGVGKRWRVVGVLREPSVTVEDADEPHGKGRRMSGGVSGYMWHGFTRATPGN